MTKFSSTVTQSNNILEVTLKNVINVPRVRLLNAEFSIKLQDPAGELIAEGFAEMFDMDVLTPVSIDDATVTRLSSELGSPTDVDVKF